jgi:hypothetical protein
MIRASLEIVLRTGTSIVVNFPDDEAVNFVVERLKKAITTDAVFPIDILTDMNKTIVHYLPTREIVRFSVTQNPRVAAST